MPKEVTSVLTPLTIPLVWNALLLRWETLGVNPTRGAVELKLAHIHLETGLSSCHCWNLGNIKHVDGDGRDWCNFTCGEEIEESKLASVVAMAPQNVSVVARYTRSGAPWVSIRLTPPHPWCRFRAFPTLEAGIDEQLAYLKNPKRQDVLGALQTGDPTKYCERLAAHSYFTASTSVYRRALVSRLEIVKDATDAMDWGDVT